MSDNVNLHTTKYPNCNPTRFYGCVLFHRVLYLKGPRCKEAISELKLLTRASLLGSWLIGNKNTGKWKHYVSKWKHEYLVTHFTANGQATSEINPFIKVLSFHWNIFPYMGMVCYPHEYDEIINYFAQRAATMHTQTEGFGDHNRNSTLVTVGHSWKRTTLFPY